MESQDMEQFMKYRYRWGEAIKIFVGAAIKYSSLLAGIYSVCKDEKNFSLAMFAGAGYLIGEGLQRMGTEANDVKKFSNLEKTLKEK